MNDVQGFDINWDEIWWLNISSRNATTKSNEHRSKVESVELVETMKILKREVKRYREYNERIIRSQEY
jgi:hypothetical protein